MKKISEMKMEKELRETQESKEEISPILDFIFNKFRATRNSIAFSGIPYMWNYCFPRKYIEKRNKYSIMIEYEEKLQNQFDVFYYMQQNRKLNLIEDIMFSANKNMK